MDPVTGIASTSSLPPRTVCSRPLADSLMTVWLLLALVGWWLLFCSTEDAVVNATTQSPCQRCRAPVLCGLYIDHSGLRRLRSGQRHLAACTTAGSCQRLLSLYAHHYVYAEHHGQCHRKRHVALSIHALGNSPLQILRATHDNGKYTSLVQQLQPLQQAISRLGQQHLAYPILHYYHDP